MFKEKADLKFPANCRSNEKTNIIIHDKEIFIGTGLHDSSAALIPYLKTFNEPFVLISTGTWCISLNPFNNTLLTDHELHNDCLCYLSYEGKPVKASRLFAGHEHEEQVKRIASYFNQSKEKYLSLKFDKNIFISLNNSITERGFVDVQKFKLKSFEQRDLSEFKNDIEAYYQLIMDLVALQFITTGLILKGSPIKRIFVDGGFSNNEIYMHLLSFAFKDFKVYAAAVSQSSALGAALVIHDHWNKNLLPDKLITLKKFKVTKP